VGNVFYFGSGAHRSGAAAWWQSLASSLVDGSAMVGRRTFNG
jgi:hypothetical protein